MVKLKIGTGTSKKKQKPKQEKEDDYFSDLSDEEIEAIQIGSYSDEEKIDDIGLKILRGSIDTEVKESVQTALDVVSKEEEALQLESHKEVIEIPEEIKEEEEIKEAVNGVFILDEVGISVKSATAYASLFPKKKVVYRGLFTKAFLKWYITNVKVSKLKEIYIIESEYVKPEQKDEIMKWITKRLKAPAEEPENIGITLANLAIPKLVGESTELETQEDIDIYEFLLSEKWKELNRAKGITQLDAMLEEQMRVQKLDMTDALKYLIDGFKLQTKWYNLTKTKKDSMAEQMVKEAKIETEQAFIKEHEVIFSGREPNKGSNAEKIREIDRSIKRFHHIKFLYELMEEKMEFVKGLTKEEIKHIGKIDELLTSTVISEGKELPTKKSKKTTESMDKFFEGD